ncbi:MAG: winged helix-turn-helix transcriptional regulator [Phycisphaerae bacterium]|nr:winged helix-turn-helix transcriptional regulator [Phycisphaerae bacterium]
MAGQQRQTHSLAQAFRILGDPTRLAILLALGAEEMNVTELCRKLRLNQPTVSRHLGILKMSAFAQARRSGKEIYYSVPASKRRSLRSVLDRAETLGR